MGYASAFKEDWGTSSRATPRIRDYWRELANRGDPKSSYIPDFDREVDECADIFVLADKPINRLRERYEFRNDTVVEDFLRDNSYLTNLLSDAHEEIREHFGSEVRAALKVIQDPDVREDQRLFVLIQTTLDPGEALDQLDELYDDWWLDALSKARHKMSIDVEYH